MRGRAGSLFILNADAEYNNTIQHTIQKSGAW